MSDIVVNTPGVVIVRYLDRHVRGHADPRSYLLFGPEGPVPIRVNHQELMELTGALVAYVDSLS